jgi:hypothetical protein
MWRYRSEGSKPPNKTFANTVRIFEDRLDASTTSWPTRGYEPTREAAMAAFARSWRRE